MSDTPIKKGQIWRRQPDGFLYKVIEIDDGAGSNITLRNVHNSRISRISELGLRKKMELHSVGSS